MAEYTTDMQSFKPSFSFLDIEPNMELMNHFPEMNPSFLQNSALNFQSFMGGFSNHNFLIQQAPEFPGNLAENFPRIFLPDDKNLVSTGNNFHESKKRKSVEVSETSSWNSSPPVSDGLLSKNTAGRGKRAKGDEKEEEKPKEVVHVRARRGQATDSHSLAERVRRGKINERLKCLQDIVPGCYKTMGMAVMLDEIINYVQSLQNQVEFLSMKLTTASRFYDFNSETDAVEIMQRANAYEEQKVQQRHVRAGYEGIASTQLAPFDFTFGSHPSLPYHT